MFSGPSVLTAPWGSITHRFASSTIRHASFTAGVARGLRASGVEPATRRQLKGRTSPRRGPNTGASGQYRSPQRPDSSFRSSEPNQTRYSDRSREQIPREERRRSFSQSDAWEERSSRAPRDSMRPDRRSNTGFSTSRSSRTFSDDTRDDRPSRPSLDFARPRHFDAASSSTRSPRSFSDNDRDELPRRPSRDSARPSRRFDTAPSSTRPPRSFSDDAEAEQPSASRPFRRTDTTSTQSRPPNPFPVPYTTATSVFVPGRRAAEAILLANRRSLYTLYLSHSSRSSVSVRQLEDLASTRRCTAKHVPQDYIDRVLTTLKMSGTVNDGVLLECADLTYTPTDALAKWDPERHTFAIRSPRQHKPHTLPADPAGASWRPPLLLWLHEVVNTANIAALYRSALYFGVDGVVLSERGTGRIQPSALRASAGAVEFLPTLTVSDPKSFMADSKRAGWRFLGAMPPAKRGDSRKVDVMSMAGTVMSGEEARPSVLVLGNEDQGLSGTIREQCDVAVTVPAAGETAARAGVDSLNVGVAGTLLFSRLLRRPEVEGRVRLSEEGDVGRVF